MGIARSTYYASEPSGDGGALVAAITAICDEFEAYGWRRVRAALRQQGIIANHKRIRRLMREHGLQPKRRRRYVSTTDSDHDEQIFPDRAKDMPSSSTRPALGGGPHLRRDHRRLRLRGCNPRWVVAPGRGLRHRPFDRRRAQWRRCVQPSRSGSVARLHPPLRPRIPVCGRRIGTYSPPTASSARWGGAAIRTTMPRSRAS